MEITDIRIRKVEGNDKLRAYVTVAFDDEGRSFAAYNVQYLPFGVLVTAKGRALWMGNPRQLTEAVIESNL